MPPRPAPPRLTHFLCLPLVTPTSRPQLQASLSQFRDAVTTSRTRELPNGIPETAVRPLGTLHLTLGVMSLLTPERVDSALKVLREINLLELLGDLRGDGVEAVKKAEAEAKEKEKEKSGEKEAGAGTKGLEITLKGLESMHTPTKTSILYSAPVDPGRHIYTFSQKLRDIFTAADLVIADTRPLLLHATIVNTVYVPGVRGKGSGHGKDKAKLTLDVTELLEDYEDFVWMEGVRLEKVAICRMGARASGEGGGEEYVVEGEVDMP